MTAVLVDANVILDLVGDDPAWGARPSAAIAGAVERATALTPSASPRRSRR